MFIQWKGVFSIIKALLAFITVIVLLAGTLQGAISYTDYCDNDGNDYPFYNYKKRCDFTTSGEYNADVDFVSVVVISGVGLLFWVSENGPVWLSITAQVKHY